MTCSSRLADIRNALARQEYLLATHKDGFEIDYSHQGGAATELWARSDTSSVRKVEENGVVHEYEYRAFRISSWRGCSTGIVIPDISENDELTVTTSGLDISDNVYVVREWDTENNGAVYTVYAELKVTRRSDA